MVHEIKIDHDSFMSIVYGEKTFAVREDRNYRVGDTLLLKEFDGKEYTGRMIERKVSQIVDTKRDKEECIVLHLER